MHAIPKKTPSTPSAPGFSMPPLLWGSASLAGAAAPMGWLWESYLAPGAVTLLTGQWKAGKTTLASILLARMRTGGQLAGLALTAGKAVVVTEEGADHWQRRNQKTDFGDHVGWYCQPFRGKPLLAEWSAFVDGLADLHDRQPFSLLLIDPLAAFLPGGENHAASVLEALAPLQTLKARGLSILALHHPSKGDPPIGQAARGSGALSGYADVVIEMRAVRGAQRRRRLWAWSRYPQTPRRRVIEWTADGLDYLACGVSQDDFARPWRLLESVFAAAPHKLTRTDVCRRWTHGKPPESISLRRWLQRAVSLNLLRKDGEGLRNKPFRYWLPAREEAWRQDPIACCLMPELLDKPST
jgi:hypothetical protein